MHYSESELLEMFGSVGSDVRIHRSCIILGGKRIHVGSHVRDFRASFVIYSDG